MPAARILFKYTSRSRVVNFFRGLDSIVNNLSNTLDYHIQCTFDTSDNEYNNDAFRQRLSAYKNVSFHFGTSTGKIDAINRDLELMPSFDILVNMSDDMQFLVKGFDDIIRNDMQASCNDFDLFLHYPDTFAKDALPTLSIMGVNYFKRTGTIYNRAFISVSCDNYAMDEARSLDKYVFIDKAIFDHFHPAAGKGEMDEQYLRTENPEIHNIDKETYNRLSKSLPLPPATLSILIPSLVGRENLLWPLVDSLSAQCGIVRARDLTFKGGCFIVKLRFDHVEIIIAIDDKGITTGTKRNLLLTMAVNDYVAHVDCDDSVYPCYIAEALLAIRRRPDCVAMRGIITTDGQGSIEWRLSKDYQDETISEQGKQVYLRTTNHLSMVKRELAIHAGFPDKSNAEDKEFSRRLLPFLHSETKIDELMYHYRYSTLNKTYQ